ncbi:MAG: 5-formyltetrahydrofolate cyclo-ligase, partial [Rhizobiales bacterium]|nr:5-formyltetrahydrofolate cyclo-ligase [Hyphomicrobiales bacterium]
QAAADIRRWRKAERERLIAARLAVPADIRAAHGQAIAAKLDALLGDLSGRLVGLYWPFRGEPDLRGWAETVRARGGQIALPVVVEKARPLVFRLWRPGEKLEKGVWNIPVPAVGDPVLPDIVVSPVVGFDAGSFYRLGYGGGFYDRTLAAMPRRPRFVVGVGYALQRIPTIYPQPHDIPVDVVLTEEA